MPSDEKSQYAPEPPIPSYDEATRGGSSSRPDWQPPPASPLDTRPDHETESQSLLTTSQPRQQPGGGRQAADGYRAPYVESDDDGSEWTLESDDDGDSEAGGDRETVRREMEELEVEDPLMNGSTSSRSSSLWRKPISFTLPQWRWRWRLPRLTVRLPRANDSVPNNSSNSNGNAGSGGNTVDSEERGTADSTEQRRWWQRLRVRLPKWEPQMGSSAALLLMARLLALFLILGFVWLLFMTDVFTNMSRRIGGSMFDPEQVRQHVMHMVDPAQMRATVHHFTSYAHLAGTEGDWALARDVRNAFLREGLEDVVVDEYQVFLNYPRADGRAVEILEGEGDDQKTVWRAKLEELDLGSESPGHPTLAFHAHSRSGDVRGPLIYAHYGSRDDFRQLKDLGVETEGAIALVRYHGGRYGSDDPALKVRAAELAGFAGCLIYSDPADDGFVRGDVAPNGRFMPADGVRRASVSRSNLVMGDLLTPGWESIEGQPRMTLEQAHALPGIPSLPLAWRDAQELLQRASGFGAQVPGTWRGGVPGVGDTWWSGNASGPVVRLRNEQDEEPRQKIWNVYGRINGIEQSERKIFVGNHRDARSFGGADPGSGTAVMIEVARVIGDLAARGWRPLRTVEFASFDAGAYNLEGSTEFVENNLDLLHDDAYAYINLGAAVSGSRFHAAGSPVFRRALARVLDRVVDPNANATLRALWDAESEEEGDEEGREEEDGDGGGSGAGMHGLGDTHGDYAPFQLLAGTSALDLSFVEAGASGRFPAHSAYDTYDWVSRVGDPDFAYHALLAQVVLLLVLELADRPVLPFDMANYALQLGRYAEALERWVAERHSNSGSNSKGERAAADTAAEERRDGGVMDVDVDVSSLRTAAKTVEHLAAEFDQWQQAWEASIIRSSGWEPSGLGKQRCAYNDRMAGFDTALLDLEYGGGVSYLVLYLFIPFFFTLATPNPP